MGSDYTSDPSKTKLEWVEGAPDAPPPSPPQQTHRARHRARRAEVITFIALHRALDG
jgi:hypothetical protein